MTVALKNTTDKVFQIQLDDLTSARLFLMAMENGAHPCSLISAIIHDVLEDDAKAHEENAPTSVN